MFLGLDLSPWTVVGLLWLALQVLSWFFRAPPGPPGPPGGRVVAIHNDTEWADAQKEATDSGTLTVVDFSATWCPPCRRIGPMFAALSEKYSQATFLKVDVDEARGVAGKCGIRSMPTFHFYKNGKRVEEFSGADERRLEELLLKHGARAVPPPPPTPAAAS